MTSLVQTLGDRVVGTVEEVSTDRIIVLLDPDAPQATALNTGAPMGFPRINGYVLIHNESGAIACVISSVRIERLPFPKRKGMQKDFGLVDLPFPSRLMSLTPLGTLKAHSTGGDLDGALIFPGPDLPEGRIRRMRPEFLGNLLDLHENWSGRSPAEQYCPWEGSEARARAALGVCAAGGAAA